MNWGMYGILIIFGIFIILMIVNPRLSCFGKAIRSPLYPLVRKRKKRQIKTHDYGFKLSEGSGGSGFSRIEMKREGKREGLRREEQRVKTEDYGFKLIDDEEENKTEKTDAESKKEENMD